MSNSAFTFGAQFGVKLAAGKTQTGYVAIDGGSVPATKRIDGGYAPTGGNYDEKDFKPSMPLSPNRTPPTSPLRLRRPASTNKIPGKALSAPKIKKSSVTLASPPKHNDTAGIDVNPVAAGTPEGKETLTKKKVPVKAEDVVSSSKAAYFGSKLAGQVNFYERVPKDEKKRKNPASLNPSAAGENPISAEEPSEQDEFNIKGAFEFGRKLAQVANYAYGTGAPMEVLPKPKPTDLNSRFVNWATDTAPSAAANSDLAWALGEGARHYGGKLQDFGAGLAEKMRPYSIPTEAFTNPGSDPVFGGSAGGSAGSAPSGQAAPGFFGKLKSLALSPDAFTASPAPVPEGWTRDAWTGQLTRPRADYQPNKLEVWNGVGTPPGAKPETAAAPTPAPAPEAEPAAPPVAAGKSPYQREYLTETTRIGAGPGGEPVALPDEPKRDWRKIFDVDSPETSAATPAAPAQADPVEQARGEAAAAPAGEPAAAPPGPAPAAQTGEVAPAGDAAPGPAAASPAPAAEPGQATGQTTGQSGGWSDYLMPGLGAGGLATLAYLMMQENEKKKKRRDDEE